MEMCYDGALVMPSSYAVMDEDEMMYVEGGGTFTLYLSKRAVSQILTVGAGVATGILAGVLGGGNLWFGIAVGAVSAIFVDYILNNMITVKDISITRTAWYLPNRSFSYK